MSDFRKISDSLVANQEEPRYVDPAIPPVQVPYIDFEIDSDAITLGDDDIKGVEHNRSGLLLNFLKVLYMRVNTRALCLVIGHHDSVRCEETLHVLASDSMTRTAHHA